jgi:hypothetical protein
VASISEGENFLTSHLVSLAKCRIYENLEGGLENIRHVEV